MTRPVGQAVWPAHTAWLGAISRLCELPVGQAVWPALSRRNRLPHKTTVAEIKP
jgi:hypothetical protein